MAAADFITHAEGFLSAMDRHEFPGRSLFAWIRWLATRDIAVTQCSGNKTLTGQGSTTITTAQAGDVNYTPATAAQVLTVK